MNIIPLGRKPLPGIYINSSKNTFQEYSEVASDLILHQVDLREHRNTGEQHKFDDHGVPEILTTKIQTVSGLVNVSQLKQPCKNLKFRLIKMIFSKQNAVLKMYQKAYAALTEQNEILRSKVEELTPKVVT